MKQMPSTLLLISLALAAGSSQASECTAATTAALPRAVMPVPIFAFHNPWADFNGLQAMMDRQMNALGAFMQPVMLMPPMPMPMRVSNLQQTSDGYRLDIPLPGYKPEDIRVRLEGQWLSIAAQSANTLKVAGQTEQSSFAESLALPGPVDAASLRQSYKDGMLTVIIPKRSANKS